MRSWSTRNAVSWRRKVRRCGFFSIRCVGRVSTPLPLKLFLLTFFAIFAGSPVWAQPKPTAAAPAAAAPNPAYAQVADVPGLPRVLILGDSISIGYTLLVRKQLEGRANVHRPAENCAETANGVKRVWLRQTLGDFSRSEKS